MKRAICTAIVVAMLAGFGTAGFSGDDSAPALADDDLGFSFELGEGTRPATEEDWAALRAAEANAPGDGGHVEVVDPLNLQPETHSASGCNGRVCIFVQGRGTEVVSWKTTTTQYSSDGYRCLSVVFEAGGFVRDGYALECWEPPPGVTSKWFARSKDVIGKYNDGTQLCNTWAPAPPFSGRPCILIKANRISLGPIKI